MSAVDSMRVQPVRNMQEDEELQRTQDEAAASRASGLLNALLTKEDPDAGLDKKRKFKVCSGQTDDERRRIRQMQRVVAEELQQPEPDLPTLKIAHNVLFSQVRFHREAVLDASNQDSYARQMQRQIDQTIAESARSFSACDMIQSLRQNCATKHGNVNWEVLGREGGICFNRVPPRVHFMQGAFGPSKERNSSQLQDRVAKLNMANVRAERPKNVVKETAKDDPAAKNTLSAMEKLISGMKKAIVKNATDTGDTKLDAMDLVWNAQSFTQTVENMFTASFHVKAGNLSMNWKDSNAVSDDNDTGNTKSPWEMNWSNETDRDTTDEPERPRQAIISFTLADWKRVSRQRREQECLMTHREGYPDSLAD